MDISVRRINDSEYDRFLSNVGAPFGFIPSSQCRRSWQKILKPEDCIAAFDGESIVGTHGCFYFDMVVPGAQITTAGVTAVTVVPTHRRCGILKNMQMEFASELLKKEIAMSACWPSEDTIYGRFGTAPATDNVSISLLKTDAVMSEPIDIRGKVRFVDNALAFDLFPEIYRRSLRFRIGRSTRGPNWWKGRVLKTPFDSGEGVVPYNFVVHQGDDGPDAYAIYTTTGNVYDGELKLSVVELIGSNLKGEKALWQYLFEIDLIKSIDAPYRPVDDPLVWWLKDPRKMRRQLSRGLWVRLVNVERALSSRRYSSPGRVSFRCIDSHYLWNDAVFRLDVDSHGWGRCRKTEGKPEIEISARALSAAYLGGRSFCGLVQSSLVSGPENIVRKLDNMFRWDSLPWSCESF